MELTDAKELSAKLQSFESNVLLFNFTTRTSIKLARVIIDTYIAAQEESQAQSAPLEKKAEHIIKEIEAEERAEENLKELTKELEGTDEEEIRETIKEAARQLGEKKNVEKSSKDYFKVARRYLSPDKLANIAVYTLPLITWQFRWALALGLGAYTVRKSVVHGAKGIGAMVRRDWDASREEGKNVLTTLKAASGNILIIGLSPAVARAPKFLISAINFAIDKTYTATIEKLKGFLNIENAPSEPLSKRIKNFFRKNMDSLSSISIKTLKELLPTKFTTVAAQIANHVTPTHLTRVFNKASELGQSLKVRFNAEAERLGFFSSDPQEKPQAKTETLAKAESKSPPIIVELLKPALLAKEFAENTTALPIPPEATIPPPAPPKPPAPPPPV